MNTNNPNKIKIGDVITTYHPGYFKVIKIKRRWVKLGGYSKWDYIDESSDPALRGEEGAPIVVYLKIAKPDGTPIKGKVPQSCDSAYCKLAIDAIPKRIESLDKEKEQLLNILKSII